MKMLRFVVLLTLLGVFSSRLPGAAFLVVAEEDAQRVSVFGLDGSFLRTLSPSPSGWSLPTAAAFDPSGHVWISDYFSSTLYEFSVGGSLLGSMTSTDIVHPVGLAFNASGNILVSDRNLGNQVCELTTAGATVGACILLSDPRGVGFNDGFVYVSSSGADVLNRYAAGTLGPSVTAKNPRGIAFDSLDNVYVAVADADHADANMIVRYNAALGGGTTFIGTGLDGANGLAFDGDGHLYVSNYFTGTIMRFDADGTNPTALVTGLTRPSGIAVSADIPEPGTLLTLALGLGVLMLRRRRR